MTASRVAHQHAASVSTEALRLQLDRILGSDTFAHAPMLRRLLGYLVERTLAEPERLKEYAIGVDVFERGESFDPRVDTIVRVQARRLRQKLAEYYATAGEADPVRIDIPRGRYAASFSGVPASVEDRPRPPEVLADAPPRDTSTMAASEPPRRFAVPVPVTRLLGREQERAELQRLLTRSDVRLVTLTGPGGSGKTRLAMQMAEDLTPQFPGGVLFVPLATTVGSRVAVTTLAQAFGLRNVGGHISIEVITDHLRTSVIRRTLLILDTFEHLLSTAPMLVELLSSTANLVMLVTSRATLRVSGEHAYPVLPLPVPVIDDSDEAIRACPSVQLFVERASAADPTFEVRPHDLQNVAAICRRLDGLPLAIELAAARVRLFPTPTILQRLTHALDFLTDGPNDVPVRQQALRQTIDWSYQLLSPPEQQLLRRLAVFAGGWTLEAAEAVCNGWRDMGIDSAAGVASLLDKSLIGRVHAHAGEARFDMLEAIREYALEQLAATEDPDRTRRAHAAYCIVLAEEREADLTADGQLRWLERCDVELGNLRTAANWLLAQHDRQLLLRLLVGLFPFWQRREQFEEARTMLEAGLALDGVSAADSTSARAWSYLAAIASAAGEMHQALAYHTRSLETVRALGDRRGEAAQLTSIAVCARFLGDPVMARVCFTQSLAICRELGETAREAEALSNLAAALRDEGDLNGARQLLTQAKSLFETLGHVEGAAWTDNKLGDLAHVTGDIQEARTLYQRSIDAFQSSGNQWGLGRTAIDLAYVLAELDDVPAARESLRSALDAFRTLNDRRGIARVLECHAWLAQRVGSYDRALVLGGAAVAVRRAFGVMSALPPVPLDGDGLLDPAWRAHPTPMSEALWEKGRAMTADEALAYAFD